MENSGKKFDEGKIHMHHNAPRIEERFAFRRRALPFSCRKSDNLRHSLASGLKTLSIPTGMPHPERMRQREVIENLPLIESHQR
jgi:hypothetical protein